MTVNYTSLLGLALPVTGTEAGAWGDVVNNYLTSYLDASVAGTQTITGSQTAVTLAVTNGATLVTVGSGATGSAQFQIITCTGNPASLLTITAPASSRQYIIINSTSTSQSVQIVGAGPTTGVTIVSGEKAHVAWNGSDFVKIATQSGNGSFVDLTVSGNLTLSGGTANGVPYLSSPGKVLTTGSALTFDGNTLTATNTSGNAIIASRGGKDLRFSGNYAGANTHAVISTTTGMALAFMDESSEFMRLTSTGLKSSIAGTNADPAFSYTSDTNTGIFFPAADKLGFTAGGGSDQMVLTSTGLGIGTSSPSYKLQVYGTDPAIAIQANAGTSDVWTMQSVGSDNRWRLVNNTSGYGEVLTMTRTGNLGLGVTPSTISAGRNLEVGFAGSGIYSYSQTDTEFLSNAYYNVGYKFGGTGRAMMYAMGTAGSGIHSWHTSTVSGTANSASVTSGASYTVVALGTTTLAQWQAFFNDSSNNPLTVTPTLGQVLTGNATGTLLGGGLVTQNISFTQAMTLDASGNLVIGDTSASSRLDVKGPTGNGISYRDGTVTNYLGTTGSNLGYLGTLTNHPVAFLINATEKARITSDGYFKASNNGSYDNSAGLYHELDSDQDSHAVYIKATNASLSTTGIVQIGVSRNTTNNSFYAISYYNGGAAAYKFRVADSGAIGTAGSITLGSTTPATSGIGVQFPATQSASSDANTLDDYEEGTWTPTMGGATFTYTSQGGRYTKVGNVVTVWAQIDVASYTSATGLFSINNLPFTVVNDATVRGGASTVCCVSGITFDNYVTGEPDSNSVAMYFESNRSNNTRVDMNSSNFAAGGFRLFVTSTYQTSA